MKLQDNGDIILHALPIPDRYILNLKMKKKICINQHHIWENGGDLWRSLHQFSSICHLCILGFSSVLGFNVKFICVIYMLPVKIYHYIITQEEFFGTENEKLLFYYISSRQYFNVRKIWTFLLCHFSIEKRMQFFLTQVSVIIFGFKAHFMECSIYCQNFNIKVI